MTTEQELFEQIAGIKNEWLLLDSVQDCKNLVARINTDRVADAQAPVQLGYPIILNNGKVVQNVKNCENYLTQEELDARVKSTSFQDLIKENYLG